MVIINRCLGAAWAPSSMGRGLCCARAARLLAFNHCNSDTGLYHFPIAQWSLLQSSVFLSGVPRGLISRLSYAAALPLAPGTDVEPLHITEWYASPGDACLQPRRRKERMLYQFANRIAC